MIGLRTAVIAVCALALCAAAVKDIYHGQAGQVDRALYNEAFGLKDIPLGRGNTYYAQFHWTGSQHRMNMTFHAGQEVRFRVSTQFKVDSLFTTFAPAQAKLGPAGVMHNIITDITKRYNSTTYEGWLGAVNTTGPSQVRIRVVPAYASRGSSGLVVACSHQTDRWAEFWALSGRNLAWGHTLAFSAYSTFVVPPFPFKLCVKDVTSKNHTRRGRSYDGGENAGWTEFSMRSTALYSEPSVFKPKESLYLYSTASVMQASDYAAIKIWANGRAHFDTHRQYTSGTGTNGDIVKLVPAGYPCTYEKRSASADLWANNYWNLKASATLSSKQYCGSNQVSSTTGEFSTTRCAFEGSFSNGVFLTGTNAINPYVTSTSDNTAITTGYIVAYGKLPAAGNYDICLSPHAYRSNATADRTQASLVHGTPVWFKVYKADSSCPTSNAVAQIAGCAPRTVSITVATASSGVSWSSDDTTPLSWGTVKVTSTSNDLNSGATTAGDTTTTKEFVTTVGGDQFRFIQESDYRDVDALATGDLYVHPASSTQPQVSIETTETSGFSSRNKIVVDSNGITQYVLDAPSSGSTLSSSGCWAVAPGTGTDNTYATYSGDLGGNPRTGWTPWTADASSQTSVWAFMRFPQTGRWRVCYRKVGTHNWRVIPRDTSAWYFFPSYPRMYSNVTYHINDTRTNSYGEFVVHDPAGQLTTEDLNFLGSSTPIVGSAIKLVTGTQDCQTSTATVESWKPGLPECWIGKCSPFSSATCNNCLGPLDDSTTTRKDIAFFLRVPSHLGSGYYRVCFKQGASNWRQLRDPAFSSAMSSAEKFNTRDETVITYTISDTTEGSWGKFTFSLGAKNQFSGYFSSFPDNVNNDGDVVRLIVNETSHRFGVGCNAAFGTASGLAVWDAAKSNSNLGLKCAASTSNGPCTTAHLSPTDGGLNGVYPYTDVDSTNDMDEIPIGNGTVAFITIPSALYNSRPASYRVCYKQSGYNWVEAVGAQQTVSWLTVSTRNPVAHSATGSSVGGAYTYIELTGTATWKINPNYDLVKLVPYYQSCDRPAAGTQSHGNKYLSFAGTVTGSNGAVVDASNINAQTQSAATTARAYLVLPTDALTTPQTVYYTICYMRRASASDATMNWVAVDAIPVTTQGITYTVTSAPHANGAVTFQFLAGGNNALNTLAGGDSAKIVSITSPCLDGTSTRPYGVTSLHVGYEGSGTADGITDLGPTNEGHTSLSQMTTTLPSATSTYYKVCYKRYTADAVNSPQPWFEVEQTTTSNRVYSLSDNLLTVDSGIGSLSISSSLYAQSPASSQTTYAGANLYTTYVIGGASSAVSGSNYVYVTGTGLSTSDAWKLVIYQQEVTPGVYRSVPGATCASDGFDSGTVSSSSTTTQAYIVFNFPLSGNYLFCYKKAADTTWTKVAGANPISIIPSNLQFSASTTTQLISVWDVFRIYDNNQGRLLDTDKIYFVNGTDVCGLANSFDNTAITSATVPLNGSDAGTGWYMPVRTTGLTASWLTTTALGSKYYKACLYVSDQAGTNSSGIKPFLKQGWYQIMNVGDSATGGGTEYYSTTKATTLAVTCPSVLNTSVPMRSGTPFSVTVRTVDSSGNTVPLAIGQYAYEVIAGVNKVSVGNSKGDCSADQAVSYGWDKYNLHQFARRGQAVFRLNPTSACPTEGCSLVFSSPSLASSGACNFALNASDPARLDVVTSPATCRLNSKCSVRLAAFSSDLKLAYTSTATVTVTVSGNTGFTVAVAIAGVTTVLAPSSTGALSSGYFDLDVEPSLPTSLFAADTSITIAYSVAGLNLTTSMKVLKPTLSRVQVIDVYPDPGALTGNDVFIRAARIPTWEPTGSYFQGGQDVQIDGASSVTAASGYYLVAQQFYTVILRAVSKASDNVEEYMNDAVLIDTVNGNRQISIVDTDLVSAGNSVIKSSGCLDENCASRFTTVAFTKVKQPVSFRLKNSKGCRTAAPCKIEFQFDGGVVGQTTAVTTPVRSVATHVTTQCWADDGVSTTVHAQSDVGATVCPQSTVENGWYLRVSAVDEAGDVDEFFQGNFLPLLDDGNGINTTQGVSLTTVAALQAGTPPGVIAIRAAAGTADVPLLTLSRPCARECNLQIVSDWGTGLASVGSLVATPSTTQLKCTLVSRVGKCQSDSPGATCDSIAGVLAYDTTTDTNNLDSLIYQNTEVCVNVQATNANGASTLYETNWILYWAQAVSPSTTVFTVKDTTTQQTDRRRYKPLVRSSAVFCFTLSAASLTTKATVRVRFAAQRFNDANYWSIGTTGECNVGVFTVWQKKHLASVQLTKVTGMDAVGALPTSTPVLALQRTGTGDPAVTLEWGYFDHYGKSIATADLQTTAVPNINLLIGKCGIDILNSDCTSGSLASGTGTAELTQTGDGNDRGMLTLTVQSTKQTVIATGPAQYTLTLAKYCIGCQLSFPVANTDGSYKILQLGDSAATAVTSTVELNVLMQDDATVTRQVLFALGQSPLLSGNSWATWDESSQAVATGQVALFKDTCWTTSSCMPTEAKLLLSHCDARPSAYRTISGASSSTDIKMYVVKMESGGTPDTYKQPQCTAGNCKTAASVFMQVDILTSYSVGVTIGNQILHCTTGTCTDDSTTTPKNLINAYGATAKDAILALRTASSVLRTTAMTLEGMSSSAFYSPTTSTGKTSVAGKFSASATTNTTGITVSNLDITGYSFAWRGPAVPVRVAVLDVAASADPCSLTDTQFQCLNNGGCAPSGYYNWAKLETISFNYAAQAIPVGQVFPLTVEIQDSNGYRVATAAGTVTFSLESWYGCNNGGTLSGQTSVQVIDGRATGWLSFTAACEKCVVKGVFSPLASQSTMYATLLLNPGALTVRTKAIQVQGDVSGTTFVIAAPAASAIPAERQISTVTTLTIRAIGNYGGLAATASTANVVVALYNEVKSRTNAFWYGNGGIIRTGTDKAPNARHGAAKAFTGEGTIDFLFTRTCDSCSVLVVAWINNAVAGPFRVQNAGGMSLFSVTTALTGRTLAGFRPRKAAAGGEFAVALHHIGSELASDPNFPIAIAGIAKTGYSSIASPSKSAVDNTNGDGGVVASIGFVTSKAEAQVVSISQTCNQCTVSFGADSMPINVYTTATHIRPILGAQTSFRGTFASGTSSSFTFNLRATDDAGLTDVWVGGFTNCAYSLPFVCPSSASVPVSVQLSADGVSAGGFSPAVDGFQMVATAAIDGVMNDAAKTIVNGVGQVQVTFASPVRNAIPIFTAGSLSSSSVAARGVVPPTIDVTPGSNQLSIVTAATGLDSVLTFVPALVDVGLVRAIDTTTARFVSSDADNVITASFSSGCPERAPTQAASMKLLKGYTQYPLIFASPSATSSTCTVTFAVGAGAGTCSVCTATVTVTVKAVVASKWTWIRPTALENGDLIPGPRFGGAGRSLRLSIGLLGPNPSGSGDLSVSTCDDLTTTAVETCKFEVTADSSCTNAPRIDSAVTFSDTTTPPSINVLWATSATGAAYDCALIATVTRGSTVLTAPTTAPTDKPTVTVCTPKTVAFVTNATSAYGGMFLRTGEAYPFYTVVLDVNNKHCRGDSQDDATQLSIDAVMYNNGFQASTAVQVVNVNVTETTTATFLSSLAPASPAANVVAGASDVIPAKNTVRAIAGGFQFAAVFSNSTIALGLAGINVRVKASSITPAVTSEAVSGAVDTVIAASMLRFRPDSLLPPFIASGRTIVGGARGSFIVQAVDGLSPSWVTGGLLPFAPNVARRPQEAGNDAAVSWTVSPPVDGAFPISFSTGARNSQLVNGEFTFGGLSWTGPDGLFGVQVQAAPGEHLKPTPILPIVTQLPTKVLMNTTDNRPETTATCDSNCLLSNKTFGLSRNNVTQAYQLNTTNLRAFNISVVISDASGKPVIGDSESVLEVTLENPSTATSVQLSLPDAYLANAPFQVRVMKGVAMFRLGFTGTTLEPAGTNNHTLVKIVFSCPQNRTNATLLPGESMKNPCFGLQPLKSAPIRVDDIRAPASDYQDPIVLAAMRTIKFDIQNPDLSQLNVTDFLNSLATQLQQQFPYITPANIQRVVQLVACEVVSSFGSSDLGSSVCGAQGKCSTRGSDCPTGVLQCICPASSARAMLLSRYLLQSQVGAKVAVELNFNLQAASGFLGSNPSEIAAALTSLATAVQSILSSDQGGIASAFGVDVNSLGTSNPNNPPSTLPPVTPAPPVLPPTPPSTPAPPEPTTAAPAGASVLVALLAGMLFALLL